MAYVNGLPLIGRHRYILHTRQSIVYTPSTSSFGLENHPQNGHSKLSKQQSEPEAWPVTTAPMSPQYWAHSPTSHSTASCSPSESSPPIHLDSAEPVQTVIMANDDYILLNVVKYVKVHGAQSKDHPRAVNQRQPSDYCKVEGNGATTSGTYDNGDSLSWNGAVYGIEERNVAESDPKMDTSWAAEHETNQDNEWNATPERGSFENPILSKGIFDGKLARVLVGMYPVREFNVPVSVMSNLLHDGDLVEQINALVEQKPVVLTMLPSEAFEPMVRLIYIGFADQGLQGILGWPSSMPGSLYQAARYFHYADLANEIISVFTSERRLCPFVHLAKHVYSQNGADEEFRCFFRNHISDLLDKTVLSCGNREMHISPDWYNRWGNWCDSCGIKREIKREVDTSGFCKLYQQDLLNVLVDREFARIKISEESQVSAGGSHEIVNDEHVHSAWDTPAVENIDNAQFLPVVESFTGSKDASNTIELGEEAVWHDRHDNDDRDGWESDAPHYEIQRSDWDTHCAHQTAQDPISKSKLCGDETVPDDSIASNVDDTVFHDLPVETTVDVGDGDCAIFDGRMLFLTNFPSNASRLQISEHLNSIMSEHCGDFDLSVHRARDSTGYFFAYATFENYDKALGAYFNLQGLIWDPQSRKASKKIPMFVDWASNDFTENHTNFISWKSGPGYQTLQQLMSNQGRSLK